jgi:hypothetical protein
MDSPPQFDSPAKRWNATEKYNFLKGHLQTLQKYASELHQRHLKDRESGQESVAIAEDAIERRDRYFSTLESEVQTLTIASNANTQEIKALKSTIDSQKVSAKLLSGEPKSQYICIYRDLPSVVSTTKKKSRKETAPAELKSDSEDSQSQDSAPKGDTVGALAWDVTGSSEKKSSTDDVHSQSEFLDEH